MAEIDWESGEIKQPEGATADADWEQGEIKPPPEPKGFLGHARDLGLSAVKSAIAVPETLVGLADIPTGGRVGKFLENEGGAIGFRPKQAKEFLGEFNTDAYKDQQRQFQEADGILDKTAVAIQNPSLIANTVVESAAPMLAGGVAGRAVRAVAPKVGAAAAGAIGEGTMMAGAQAEAIRQETDDGLLTAGQSGAAVATGLAGTLFGYLGGRVAQRFGLGDVDTMLARGANPQQVASEIAALPAKSVPRQVIEGAITEGFLEELPQSISEQIIQNLALGKQWSEGVEDAAVMGTLAGMAMGGGASLYSGMTRPEAPTGEVPPPATGTEPPAGPQGFTPTAERPVIDEAALGRAGVYPPAPAPIINERALEPAAPLPSQQMGLDPAAGPMSAAAALAVDTGASATMQQAAQAVDPETGEILETGARVPEQKQATDTPEQMRERLGFIEQQARVNGGWDRRTIEERDRLQAELAKVEPIAEPSAAEAVEPALAIDVSGRTDDQLRVLEQSGRDGWREAAVAEIQRRAAQQPAETPAPAVEPAAQAAVEQQAPADIAQAPAATSPAIELPTQVPTAPEQSRPAPSQRSESAQPSEAIPPATSEGWDGMTAEQRTAILTKPGGWSTAKGKLNVIGKQIAGRNWSAINPTTRATIERLMQGAPDVQSAQVDAASGQGSGAVPAGSAGVAPGRPVVLDGVRRPAGAPAPSSAARVPVGEPVVQQPASVEGRQKLAGLQAFAQQVGSNVSTEEIAALPPQEVARLYDMIVDARRLNAEVGSEWSQAAQNWIEGAVRSSIASQALGNRVADMKVRAEQFTQRSEQARAAREARKQGVQPANVPPTQQVAPQAAEAGGQEGEASKQRFVGLAAYNITNADPLKAGDSALSRDDALFELDVLQDRADRGRLTPDAFAQSGIAQRLDTAQMMTINDSIRAGDFSFIGALKSRIEQAQQPTQATAAQEGEATGEGAGIGAVAAQPAASRFDSQSGSTRTQAERDLWEKGAESERTESDVGVTAGTQVRFVSLADAVATVREAEQAGVQMTPFQVHQATGIRVGDAERVIREAQAPADAAQPDEGKAGRESVVAKTRKRKAEIAESAEQQQPDAAPPAWRTVKSAPFSDQASAVLALMNAAQKPSQSEEVEKAARALARSAEESGDATARGIATFIADNALEALASHKVNAGRGSVVEKARHKKLKDGIERLRSLEVERVTRGDEKPATEAPAGYAAQHEALMASVRTGKATPEAFKASFEQVVANEAAIKAELSAKTKAELLREGGPYMEMRYANEKKDGVVDAVYRQMIGEYALGESVTYGMARDSYQKAVRRMVEATDADKLAQYVRDREAAIQEAEVRRTARAEAMANPQTLNDYRSLMNAHIREGKTRHEAFLMLTPEQRIRYDELEAEGTREARETRKRAAQNEVRAAGQTTGGQIIATKHTRDGHDLFVVQLAERLSREDYNTVLDVAKRLGGRYSAFRGNGAVPGFQFRTREDAEAFLKLAGGDVAAAKDQVEQRRDAFADDRSQTAAERLVEMADRMERDADAEENRDRKANTARRARFASAALNAAAGQKAMARTMRNIAQAIQEGRAKFLDAVRTRTQVEALLGYVRTAKDKELRAKHPSYAEQEKRKGEPATAETAGFADFPSYTAFRSDLAMLGRQMLEIDGTKKLGQKLMSVADDVTDAYLEFARDNIRAVSQFGRGDALAEFASRDDAERAIRRSGLVGKAIVLPIKRGQNRVILSPSEAMSRKVWAGDGDKRITLSGEFGKELVEAIGRRGNKTNGLAVPWQFQNAYDRRKLLSRIGIETPSEFRSALREVIALQETVVANKVREMELAMVGRRADGLDFFPTPAEIADQMVEAADITPDMAVLEPSAGMGHIADRIREAGAEPDVIEISADRRELLQEKGYTLSDVTDFMDLKPRAFFTFGDVFRAPDGTEGVMMGGGMGSSRVMLRPLKSDGTPDMRLGEFYDREDLTGIRHRGTESGYDRIIMNPPFSDRRDAEHVQHAYTLLRPGGRIVAIMGEGVFFGQDKRAQDFRDWLDSVGGTSEKLPEGSFMDPALPVQTGVNARMVVIDRPPVDGGDRQPGDSDADVAFSATLPRDRNAVRVGITEKGLVRAMRLQFDGLAEITGKLLERGRAGKRGGVIVIDTADNAEIGRIVAERTGRKLDSTMRKFSSAGRINGFYDPKSGLTFLVGPNLNPVTATAVMLHEMMHGQQRQKIDARALEMVRNRRSLKDEDLRAFLDRVMLRMIGAGEVGNAAEASAYIVEQAVIEGRSTGYTFADNAFMQWVDAKIGKRVGDFLRSFAGMIRTWMLRNGLGAKTMTVDDFVGYAMAGLDRAVAGEVRGRANAQASIGARAPQSEAFRRWFGDSKVVDENGQPLVVYHGTQADFSVFDAGRLGETTSAKSAKMGFFFASNPDVASTYAFLDRWKVRRSNELKSLIKEGIDIGLVLRRKDKAKALDAIHDKERFRESLRARLKEITDRSAEIRKEQEVADKNDAAEWAALAGESGRDQKFLAERIDGGVIYPVYLAIQSPLYHDFSGGAYRDESYSSLVEKALKNGHDGLVLRNTTDSATGHAHSSPVTDIYVAFRPEQIKSAVGNNGDFDPDNDNILFSRSVGDAPAQEAQRVQAAIEGKTLIEAAQFLTHSNDGAKAAVAQKVLEKLQRLEKAGVALDLKIVHRGDMAPSSMVNARGYTETGFDEKGRDIVVWLNGADVTGKVGTEEEVLLHELVHAATAGMVFYGTQTPNSMAGKHARDLMAVTDAIAEHIRTRFDAADAGKATLTEFEQDMREGANNAFRSDDEALAWALSSGEAQAYLETIPYRSGSMWSNFVQAVRNLLGLSARNDTALSEVLRVAERILTDDAPNAGRAAFWHKRNIRMAQQQVRGSIAQTAERGGDDLQFSRSGMQQAARNIGAGLKAITVQDVKKAGKHKLTDWLRLGLQFLGRRQLTDVYGDVLPLADYDRLAAQMEADTNDVGAAADELARRWGKLPDEGKLADLMHDATLAQIDADSAVEYAPGDDLAASRALKAQFNQLSGEAQKVYREARDHYRKHHAEVRQAIIDRIMRSELREERRTELLKRMDADFFKAIKGVYFPLARFGQYVVVTKDNAGKVASVSRAETMAEAETMRAEMVKAFPARDGYQVGRVILSKEFVAGRDMVGRGFMTDLYEALDEQGLDPSVQAELEDTLGQLYLSSLPDLSWAKHGIHRKGTPGFSSDARRAFAQNTFHGARYLAKLKYGDQMQAELDRMQKHVDEMAPIEGFDQPAAQRVVDEMNKRHEATMNPKGNPLSTALTSFGFVYYLGISPAAAVVNLSQTPLVAYPVMGAKWGFRKAGAALMAASAEVVEGKNDLRAVLAARLKNEQDPKALRKHQDEIAAYDEAVRTGVIDVTMAHDLAGIAQGEDAKVMWKIRPVMRLASSLFHHAERFNRQATFLAAYRLARDAGAKHDTAYSQAVKATYDGHFDYSTDNRPRVMQGNVAKVVLLFKQYVQNMIYTIARNAYQSVKGESPEVRREARKVFGALMTTHAAAAGVLGLPMVGTLLALASALGGSDDEPWDAEVALRNMLADAFGPKASEVIARGFSRLTPWDISGRVDLDGLLMPDVNESLEGQRWAESFATAMLGPVIGIGVNVSKGAQKMADGDYLRGLEDMLPIAVRNGFKAARQYREGEVDRTGVVIKDEVSLAGEIGQFIGFSPSEIRLAFEGRSAVMSADRRLAERRQDLMTQFARAAMDQDQDGMADARAAIAEFNKVNPGRRITPPQMWQSVRNRERRIREADDGVYLPRTRRDVMDEGRFAEAG